MASGKILCGLGVIENELHRICAVRASRPENIVAHEETDLARARALVPRIPLSGFQVLMVDEVGKNVSGTGMDTKVIGRGVKLRPGDAPAIDLIYARDLTEETAGNALGIGLADLMHERVYRKIDLQKTHVNARVQMLPPMARLPFFLPSDREALDFGLGHLGRPEPEEQRLVWIRNTLNLERMAISEALVPQVAALDGSRIAFQLSALRMRTGVLSGRKDSTIKVSLS